MKKINISIGIAAYNEGENILSLVQSVLRLGQGSNYSLDKVYVISDGSSDNTESELSKVESEKVVIKLSKKRKGKSARLNEIFKLSRSELLVILDGDVKIDSQVFEELVSKYIETGAKLIAGKSLPFREDGMVQKVIGVGTMVVHELAREINQGANIYAFQGRVIALAADFYQGFEFEVTAAEDAYVFLEAVKADIDVAYTEKAVVYFHLPSSWGDYFKQGVRFRTSYTEMQVRYGEMAVAEYEIDKKVLVPALLKVFGRKNIYFGIYLGLHLVMRALALGYRPFESKGLWTLSKSTKKVFGAGRKNIASDKRLSVTVGIPALNAEANIGNLVRSILRQNESDFDLEKIIVHSDCSNDRTVEICQKIEDSRVMVVNRKRRIGMAGGLKKMLEMNKSDVFVMLNDDIQIKDCDFLGKLVAEFGKSENVGVVGGNAVPLKPENFIQKAGAISINAYKRMSMSLPSIHNKFTYDGKCMAMSAKFIQQLDFPKDDYLMATVDGFLYIYCLGIGMKYRYAREAKVLYKLPDTFTDYQDWVSRNNATEVILKKQFPELVEREFAIPRLKLSYFQLEQVVKSPVHCLYLLYIKVYSFYKLRTLDSWYSPRWKTLRSTKVSLG